MEVSKSILIFVILDLLLMGIGSASAQAVFPTVDYLGFNASTSTYTYRVTTPADSWYSLYSFRVETERSNIGEWSGSGPISDPSTPRDLDWNFGTQLRQTMPTMYDAVWVASDAASLVPNQTYWIGTFSLTVANSGPVAGTVLTQDDGCSTTKAHVSVVPGTVPEPSSVMGLAALTCGLISLYRRRG